MAGPAKKRLQKSTARSSGLKSKKSVINATGVEGLRSTSSPARELLARLTLEHAITSDVDDGKWSARRTMTFISLNCGLLWAGIYLAVKAIF